MCKTKKKRDLAATAWKSLAPALACPHCQEAMTASADGLLCAKGHRVDFSRKGTAYFLKNAHKAAYDRRQFVARQEIIQRGFFDPVLRWINHLLDDKHPQPGIFLDAGCGEGSQLRRLVEDRPHWKALGVDIAKEAIDLAASGPVPPLFAAADLAALPFQAKSVDALLNFLSPANYREFARVLTPGGLLIKVIPGPCYLAEIRDIVTPEQPNHDNSAVIDQFRKSFPQAKSQGITEQIPLPAHALQALLTMTPLGWRATKAQMDQLQSTYQNAVTLDLQILYHQQ